MSSGGYYQMARGWMENDFFSQEPFTEREAWQWLIEQAAWRPSRAKVKGTIVALERGQLSFAVRFMAEKWQWSKSRVDRFLKRLVAENMVKIASKNRDNSGTTAGHPAGQGQSILTICNYDKYQSPKDGERDNVETPADPDAGQQRDKEEEGKKKEIRKESSYRFEGRVIRLASDDYAKWESAYGAIPDLFSELQSIDDWISQQDQETRSKWFFRVSGILKKRNEEYAARPKQPRIPI